MNFIERALKMVYECEFCVLDDIFIDALRHFCSIRNDTIEKKLKAKLQHIIFGFWFAHKHVIYEEKWQYALISFIIQAKSTHWAEKEREKRERKEKKKKKRTRRNHNIFT